MRKLLSFFTFLMPFHEGQHIFLTQYTLIPTKKKAKTKKAGPYNNYLPLYFFH